MIATDRIEDWFAAGERVDLGGFSLFTRAAGDEGRPWLTLLHGYPTCSFDWAGVADALAEERRLLMLDFLGFGDSDKPADHAYSIHEQADLTEALWRHHGVTSTALVVHDYAVSVGQELLARHAEGKLEVRIERIAFLNGGLYPDMHRAAARAEAAAAPADRPDPVGAHGRARARARAAPRLRGRAPAVEGGAARALAGDRAPRRRRGSSTA